jgi:hypothetical protein
MSEKEAIPRQEGTLINRVEKRIIPHEESDPTVEPLFINFAHGAFFGEDFYLDIGVITLESIDPDKADTEKAGVGDFAVLNRLVMSRRTAIAIRDQINNVLEHKVELEGKAEDRKNAP